MTTFTHSIPNETRITQFATWEFSSLYKDGEFYVCWMPQFPGHPFYKNPTPATIKDANGKRIKLKFDGTKNGFKTQCQRWVDATTAFVRGKDRH